MNVNAVNGRNRKTGRYRYGGVPRPREALESAGAAFELTAAPTWLTEDIIASGEEPMTTGFEAAAAFPLATPP